MTTITKALGDELLASPRNMKDLLEKLASIETLANNILVRLDSMRSSGALLPGQARVFNSYADTLYAFEMALYQSLVSALPAFAQGVAISSIPRPVRLPRVTPGSHAVLPDGGVSGLGVLPLALPVWALLVLAAIAGAVLVAIVLGGAYLSQDLVSRLAALWVNFKSYDEYLASYETAYNVCRNRGDSPEQCRALVAAASPRNALPPPPVRAESSISWMPILIAGALGVGIFLFANRGSTILIGGARG